jgi:hypothetical protein
MIAHLATSRTPRRVVAAGVCLALLLWLAWTTPAAGAEQGPDGSPVVVAGFSLTKYFSGFANRSRVIQLCVVCMCIALLIIMKKFVDVDPGAAGPIRARKVAVGENAPGAPCDDAPLPRP